MRYELLLFDADETLFDFNKSQDESFEKALTELGFLFDKDYHLRIYKEVNSKIWKELEKGLITQDKLKVERFKRFGELAKMSFDPAEFARLYMHNLAHSSIIYPESFELLENLKENYRLVIVTNGLTAVQNIRIRQSEIAHYFEEIIISEEVKSKKPDAEIFDITLKKLNFTKRENVLMIGDNLSSDIEGGINANIDTCWFNPSEKTNTTSLTPKYEIKKLSEIIDIVK